MILKGRGRRGTRDGFRLGTLTSIDAVRVGRLVDGLRLGDGHGEVVHGTGSLVDSDDGGSLVAVGGVGDLVVHVDLGVAGGGSSSHGFLGLGGSGADRRVCLLGSSLVGGWSLGVKILLVDVDASGEHCYSHVSAGKSVWIVGKLTSDDSWRVDA